jgi:hypothetical protein
MRMSSNRSLVRSILTDLHFWLPVGVLAIGLGLLFVVARA